MISFLSAIVIMVAIGTVVQRVDILSALFEPSEPDYVFRDDKLVVEPNKLRRIVVFDNDSGTSQADRETLRVVQDPSCGQVFVQKDVLQFLASPPCVGPQVIHYTVANAPEGTFGVVTAYVQAEKPASPDPARATPERVANNASDDDGPVFLTEDGPSALADLTAGAAAPAQADTPENTGSGAGPLARTAPKAAENDPPVIATADTGAAGKGTFDTGASATGAPDTAKPDTTKPDTAKPETVKPDTADAVAAKGDERATDLAANAQNETLALAAPKPAEPTGGVARSLVRTPDVEPDVRSALSAADVSAGRVAALDATGNGPNVARPDDAAPGLARGGVSLRTLGSDGPPSDPVRGAPEPGPPVAVGPGPQANISRSLSAPGYAAGPDSAIEQSGKTDAPVIASMAMALARRLPDPGAKAGKIPDVAEMRLDQDEPQPYAEVDPAPNAVSAPQAFTAAEPNLEPGAYQARGGRPPYAKRRLTVAALSGATDREPPRAAVTEPALDGPPQDLPPPELRTRMQLDRVAPVLGQPAAQIPPASLAPGSAAKTGTALGSLLYDRARDPQSGAVRRAALNETLPPIPEAREEEVARAAREQAKAAEEAALAAQQRAKEQEEKDKREAALRLQRAACTIPPAMTIDLDRAAQSTISVTAPCHGGTVATLAYSGLKIAVPLDRDGRGSVLALGFEPSAAALLTFDGGDKIDFDLPFKGANRVSRVAMVWDQPVELELNAFEFGAKPGASGHIRPDNAKSYASVRRTGGGFLTGYRMIQGVGQNIEIYSFWHSRRSPSGVVKLAADFASRNRDGLKGTCGDGPLSAPTFSVIKSIDGRRERPILRQVAPAACSEISKETSDKRLILDAVSDLLVSR